MKVTVTFGDTSVVVPCKAGWTVRDLAEQGARRYRKVPQQNGASEVRTHHLEYSEGGILDMDDLLDDLVEDRDKLVAVFEEVQYGRTESPRETLSNGFSSPTTPSPEPRHYFSHLQYQQPASRGEIEVTEDSLKANTPLVVRSSSDSALAPPFERKAPPFEMKAPPPTDDRSSGSPETEISHVLNGALDRLSDEQPAAKMEPHFSRFMTRTVEVAGDRGPLGIHVVPYCSSLSGRTLGLHIKGIEENSRSKREKLFQEDECIVQINQVPLQDRTFAQSQELFRQAMSASSVLLEVVPVANKPRYEKNLIGQLFTSDIKDTGVNTKSPVVVRAKTNSHPDHRPDSRSDIIQPQTRSKTPEPPLQNLPPAELRSGPGSLDRASPIPPLGDYRYSPTPRNQGLGPEDSKNPVLAALANLANKKGGKRLNIDLKKGPEGLGFTVVTRDSNVHGQGPILVKNILPRGAAIKDGRLQPGDRILEVNGVDMAGRSQEELVAMLRSTKQGESVCVVVARQDDVFLPRELKGEEGGSVVLEDGREQLMYEIPLNESGSAGLGVSLKGNKSRETGEDLGIFIKSIIHGGAAYKDGRLSVNDQLVAVNGESLLGRSNHSAMETLRRSMSSEGNARGTIQLVVLRAPGHSQQMGGVNPTANTPHSVYTSTNQPSFQPSTQEPRGHGAYQRAAGPSRPPHGGQTLRPAATINGNFGHYGNSQEEEEPEERNPRNPELPVTPPQHSGFQKQFGPPDDFNPGSQFISDRDNKPRSRTSKSMDMVADESNVGSLLPSRNEPSAGGTLGPTLGLWKSSSLESLQTAVSEAQHSHSQAQVPFHRPRPHMVRGRGCNQSFRIAIDKSYEGPSEDDDDLSEYSSGFETPASSSSRQDLDADAEEQSNKSKGKKKKKKEKKKKGKKAQSVEDLEKKSKKKGFTLLRFGKKKEDKSKDAAKSSISNKLEALSEEELDRIPDSIDGYEPRYAEIHPGVHSGVHSRNHSGNHSGHVTPDMEDDDSDPNYARINHFLQPPSPRSLVSRTPSPLALPPSNQLDDLYAKVNKSRPPPTDSVQRSRAVPGYDDLDAARRRVLEYDPHRVAPRAAESRPEHLYQEMDPQNPAQPRRDPYDYPTHSRPVSRDPVPYSNPPPSSQQRYQQQQQRGPLRQEVPPSPTMTSRGRHYYEAAGGRVDTYRQASPARYTSPERNATSRERYGEDEHPDARRKHPMIGAV